MGTETHYLMGSITLLYNSGPCGLTVGNGWNLQTFVVKEVEGASDFLHHYARFLLVEVSSLVDMTQDGT